MERLLDLRRLVFNNNHEINCRSLASCFLFFEKIKHKISPLDFRPIIWGPNINNIFPKRKSMNFVFKHWINICLKEGKSIEEGILGLAQNFDNNPAIIAFILDESMNSKIKNESWESLFEEIFFSNYGKITSYAEDWGMPLSEKGEAEVKEQINGREFWKAKIGHANLISLKTFEPCRCPTCNEYLKFKEIVSLPEEKDFFSFLCKSCNEKIESPTIVF